MYEFPRNDYSFFIPFIAIKPRIALSDTVNLYALAKLGIDFLTQDNNMKAGSIYYGFGTGIEVHNFVLEFIYGVNSYHNSQNIIVNGYTIHSETIDLKLHTYTINIGYKFNL